ncbi:heterolocus tagous nuclear ribonucleoprotein [Echinococcus multilocularis]|uniref:Heterolocus tagous nuclear ribonucleoprotein n=1 Tax=Echinococcus multilocularis TaxID=6211 RepID=A0A068Y9V8_ECHMU|nr:heterolocus tagous nuclear ribonucleoprotein [Echinococcus multilocularis]
MHSKGRDEGLESSGGNAKILFDAVLLREMVESLPPLPVTQMNQSDRFNKIDEHLSEFSLIVGDGVVPLPLLPSLSETVDQRNAASPVTTVTMSRLKLYVGGLRPNNTDSQLRQHFTQYGAVTDCYVVRDSKTDKSRGYAFVTFREEAHAARALADCPQFIEGGPVNVKPIRMKINKKMDANHNTPIRGSIRSNYRREQMPRRTVEKRYEKGCVLQ